MSEVTSFSITIFVADGSPEGLKLVEKSNWDGLGIICPRNRYPNVKKDDNRPEFDRSGVYILAGMDGEDDSIYIGKAENLRSRLDIQYTEKDFWQKAIVFIRKGKDRPLNNTETGYLESRLVEIAKKNKRYEIQNIQAPKQPNMSEAEKATVEVYLSEMLLLLPVLGILAFEKIAPAKIAHKEIFKLKGKAKGEGWDATGYETGNGFTVKKDSVARIRHTDSLQGIRIQIREDLKKRGIWKEEKNGFRFITDYEFGSPSAASSVVSGSPTSGLDYWKNKDGTLKESRERNIKDD